MTREKELEKLIEEQTKDKKNSRRAYPEVISPMKYNIFETLPGSDPIDKLIRLCLRMGWKQSQIAEGCHLSLMAVNRRIEKIRKEDETERQRQ